MERPHATDHDHGDRGGDSGDHPLLRAYLRDLEDRLRELDGAAREKLVAAVRERVLAAVPSDDPDDADVERALRETGTIEEVAAAARGGADEDGSDPGWPRWVGGLALTMAALAVVLVPLAPPLAPVLGIALGAVGFVGARRGMEPVAAYWIALGVSIAILLATTLVALLLLAG